MKHRTSVEVPSEPERVLSGEQVEALRQQVIQIHVESSLVDYAVTLVTASRELESVTLGASPRASIYLIEAARASAFLQRREYVLPEDVKRVAPDVLRHRLLLSYEAEAEGVTQDALIRDLLAKVPTP